jgi:hypothetical protein
LRDFALRAGRLSIINNGAAADAGSRTAWRPRSAHRDHAVAAPAVRCRIARDGIFIGASIDYDRVVLDRFLARWPRGTAAHASYFRRLMSGPGHRMAGPTGEWSRAQLPHALHHHRCSTRRTDRRRLVRSPASCSASGHRGDGGACDRRARARRPGDLGAAGAR